MNIRRMLLPLMLAVTIVPAMSWTMEAPKDQGSSTIISTIKSFSRYAKDSFIPKATGFVKKAAIIGALDALSLAVSDYYTAAGIATNAALLTTSKAWEAFTQKGAVSPSELIPHELVSNSNGFSKKPIVASLLTLLGFLYAYPDIANANPQYVFALIVALKAASFDNAIKDSLAYNFGSSLWNLIPMPSFGNN